MDALGNHTLGLIALALGLPSDHVADTFGRSASYLACNPSTNRLASISTRTSVCSTTPTSGASPSSIRMTGPADSRSSTATAGGTTCRRCPAHWSSTWATSWRGGPTIDGWRPDTAAPPHQATTDGPGCRSPTSSPPTTTPDRLSPHLLITGRPSSLASRGRGRVDDPADGRLPRHLMSSAGGHRRTPTDQPSGGSFRSMSCPCASDESIHRRSDQPAPVARWAPGWSGRIVHELMVLTVDVGAQMVDTAR